MKTLLLFLKVKKINVESNRFSLLLLRLNQCQTLQEFLAEVYFDRDTSHDLTLTRTSCRQVMNRFLLMVTMTAVTRFFSTSVLCLALCLVLRVHRC